MQTVDDFSRPICLHITNVVGVQESDPWYFTLLKRTQLTVKKGSVHVSSIRV